MTIPRLGLAILMLKLTMDAPPGLLAFAPALATARSVPEQPAHRSARLTCCASCASAARAAWAGRLSSGAFPHAGQALKCSPGISASPRGATVLDQWQAGQV